VNIGAKICSVLTYYRTLVTIDFGVFCFIIQWMGIIMCEFVLILVCWNFPIHDLADDFS